MPVLIAVSACLLSVAWIVVAGLAWSRAELRAPEPSILIRDRHGSYLGATGGDEELVLLPPNCLNGRALFLDDVSLEALTQALGEVVVGLGDETFHTNPVWEKT